jgi:hypothetical protein
MAMTPEGRVKADIKKWLDGHGFWRAGRQGKRPDKLVGWYYMPVSNGMGVHGIPDFVIVFMGFSIFIEAKAPKGEPTANQILRMEEIRAAGGKAFVVRDASELSSIFLLGEVSE